MTVFGPEIPANRLAGAKDADAGDALGKDPATAPPSSPSLHCQSHSCLLVNDRFK